MTTSYITTEKVENCAVISLSRPEKLNAFDLAMAEELNSHLEQLKGDPAIRAVILQGRGRAFCAGGEISWEKELGALPTHETASILQRVQQIFCNLENFPKPVIAAVHGHAIGGGCELAMACDIRVADETALFSHPETLLGTVPPLGGTQRLPRLIGLGRAKYMLFTGARINARQAAEWGLVDFIVPKGALTDFVMEMAAQIAQTGPEATRRTKECVNLLYKDDFKSESEIKRYSASSGNDENTRGLQRFLERRT